MVNGFIDRANRRSMALMACESVFITGAVTLSAYVLVGDHGRPILNSTALLWRSLLIAFVCQLCLYYADVYEFGITTDRRELDHSGGAVLPVSTARHRPWRRVHGGAPGRGARDWLATRLRLDGEEPRTTQTVPHHRDELHGAQLRARIRGPRRAGS